MSDRSELQRAHELLKASLHAFNIIPCQKLSLTACEYTDTYALAYKISMFFKDVEEGAYRED